MTVLVSQLPFESATHRAITNSDSEWGLAEQLLATMADALHVANWQRSGDNKVPYPKRIIRPGVEDDTVKTTLGTAKPVDEVRSLFEKRRQAQLERERVNRGD